MSIIQKMSSNMLNPEKITAKSISSVGRPFSAGLPSEISGEGGGRPRYKEKGTI